MNINKLEQILIERIRLSLESAIGDDELEKKAHRIAGLLAARTKMNVKRQGLIDTGRLLNSIQAVVSKSSDGFEVNYGSYGVKYASAHEFGMKGKVLGIRSHTRKSKNGGTHNVRAHTRRSNIRARPYIRPALVQTKQRIADILLGKA